MARHHAPGVPAGATASGPRHARRPVLVWSLGILVALVAVAWGTLQFLFPPARVRALVASQLSTALARPVRFADASLGLWPPVRLSVSGPALAEPGGFAHGAAFQARAIHLDLDLLPLLTRHIVVRRLVLDRPQIHLVLLPDGTTNFDGLMKPKPGGAPPSGGAMSLRVRDLRVDEARVLVDDLKASRRMAFGLESRVSLNAEADGSRFSTTGDTRVRDLGFGPLTAAKLSDLNRSLAKLEWRLVHDAKFDARSKRLALGRLALGLGRAELALSGVVDDPGPRARLDLRAQGAAVDMGAVLGYLAAADARAVHGVTGGGKLDFDLRASGALGRPTPPTLTGTLSVADGSDHYPGAPAGVSGLAFTARFAPDSLGIGDLRARVADQPVRAALALTRFADPIARFAVQGDLDLASVAPLVAPADTKLGGRVAVDVRGSGRAKDPGDLAIEGSATLKDVAVQSPALPQRIEGVRGDIHFTPARATINGFAARAGKSSFTLSATATRPLALLAPIKDGKAKVAPAGVEFQLDSPYLDLAELLPVTPGAPVLPNATGGGTVHIARLRNQKLDATDVTARIGLEPGVLIVPDFGLKAYGGSSSGNARFDLRDAARPVFALKAKVDSLDADAALSAWTPVKNLLHGSLGTTLDLSGTGMTPADLKRTITAVGMAAVARGTLGPGPALEAVARLTGMPALKELRFKDGHVPFRVENGRVVTDPVVLDGEHGQWKLSGAVGFDGGLDYAVSATLPPEVASRLGSASALAAGALSDGQGRLLLDLHLGGSVASPRVAWDTRAMRDRLAGKASQALTEQRTRLESQAREAAAARLGLAPDSTRKGLVPTQQAVTDSLKRKAGGLLRGLFGGARDTTHH